MVCAQAFHWFDLDKALPEIARVLKAGGRLSLVWNQRDERVPWVRRLGAIIGTQEQLREPAAALEGSALFGEVEEAEFRFRQTIDQHSIKDLVLSRSNIATLPPAEREAKLAEVVAFYDEYGRGMDGMQLPYAARCFRSPGAGPPGVLLRDHRDDRPTRGDPAAADLGRLRHRHAAHRLPLSAEASPTPAMPARRPADHAPGARRSRRRPRAAAEQVSRSRSAKWPSASRYGETATSGRDHVAGTGPRSAERGHRTGPRHSSAR